MNRKSSWDKDYLRVLSRHPSHKILRNSILMPEGLIGVCRLGSQTEMAVDVEINSIQSVVNCANKLEMKKLFKRAGVNSPEFVVLNNNNCASYNEDGSYTFKGFEYLRENYIEKGISLLGKLTYRSRGQGMVLINTYSELIKFLGRSVIDNQARKGNPYYIEVFKNYIKEYRIHVSCTGGYFYTNRKMLKSEFVGTNNNWYRNDNNCVWYLENNEDFDKPDTWDQIVEDCQRARKALGLDICALDVKVNKKGEWVILEANSAPSFGESDERVTRISFLYQNELMNVIHKKVFNI